MEKKSGWEVWLSLILSFVAIVVSTISLVYTIRKDKMDEVEIVKVWGNGAHFDEIISYNYSGGDNGEGIIDGANSSIIISNNSKNRTSIVSYEVLKKRDIPDDRYEWCNDMVVEIKDAQGNPISFPLTLEAGEAISIQFETKTLLTSKVNELICKEYGKKCDIQYQELRKYLGEFGVNIFGFQMEYDETIKDDLQYLYMTKEGGMLPHYEVRLGTSKHQELVVALGY